ncbi:hypothetical protein [Lewinella cohaerens]|uniref:hypothetical protein n=1 Tax=Lewinella cohaerens TaxID=70995 RepID=UPI00037D2357|nr:hypothetical protein [Lewinella cohaerens]
MLSEKGLHDLKKQLHPYLLLLVKTANTIKDQDISNYPVFVVYQEEEAAGLGIPVVAAEATTEGWSVNASTLEELAAKKVVAMENVERFTTVYKTNEGAICCLVWHEGNAQFVFIPATDAGPAEIVED